MKHEFVVASVTSVSEFKGKWLAYVLARGPRGIAMKQIAFDTKTQAENCKGHKFLV